MTGKKITFHSLTSSDAKELQEISRTCFYDTFARANTPENIKTYLDKAFSEQQLLSEIYDPNSKFYFAKYNDVTAGYLKVNFGIAQTELKHPNGMELERIYVLKEYQGKKIGQALMGKAIEIALENKMDYVWLGVWTKNEKAILFYQRHHFISIGTHSFMMGKEEQEDLIMKLNLK